MNSGRAVRVLPNLLLLTQVLCTFGWGFPVRDWARHADRPGEIYVSVVQALGAPIHSGPTGAPLCEPSIVCSDCFPWYGTLTLTDCSFCGFGGRDQIAPWQASCCVPERHCSFYFAARRPHKSLGPELGLTKTEELGLYPNTFEMQQIKTLCMFYYSFPLQFNCPAEAINQNNLQ